MLFSGCATHITTDVTHNPAPAEKLSAFSAFELEPVTLASAYVGKGKNDKALLKIQENVAARMTPLIKSWNDAGAGVSPKRTLVIRPQVTEFKFINGSARFWVGPMAGSSAVVLKATISEKESGRVLATPTFYARAEAWGGAFTFGATDNVMLVRIAGRLSDYLAANYAAAVGGPSGFEPDKS
jgi:hypothetical protein